MSRFIWVFGKKAGVIIGFQVHIINVKVEHACFSHPSVMQHIFYWQIISLVKIIIYSNFYWIASHLYYYPVKKLHKYIRSRIEINMEIYEKQCAKHLGLDKIPSFIACKPKDEMCEIAHWQNNTINTPHQNFLN